MCDMMARRLNSSSASQTVGTSTGQSTTKPAESEVRRSWASLV